MNYPNIETWWNAVDTPEIEAAKAELLRLAPELKLIVKPARGKS